MPLKSATTLRTPIDHLYLRITHAKSLISAEKKPFTVVFSENIYHVRYYAPHANTAKHAIPLLIIPPLAVNLFIYDLHPERSLIDYLNSRGFAVYIIDWGQPTRDHIHYGFDHYVGTFLPNIINAVRQHSRSHQLSLHGWSMGGIFTLLYAAYAKDPDITNLIVMGTPINTHAGSIGKLFSLLYRVTDTIEHRTGLHPRQLPLPLLHTPGWLNALSFKMLDPLGTLMGHYSLLRKASRHDAIVNHATLGAFLNDMLDYPGAINRDMVVRIWLENSLMKRGLKINNSIVSLTAIRSNLLVVAGMEDSLVSTEASHALAHATQSTDITLTRAPGGHVGMMSSKKAAHQFWPELAAWLEVRSDAIVLGLPQNPAHEKLNIST